MTGFLSTNKEGNASFPTTLKSHKKYVTSQGISATASTKPVWFRVTKQTYSINKEMLWAIYKYQYHSSSIRSIILASFFM
jgi:hypothetical protein